MKRRHLNHLVLASAALLPWLPVSAQMVPGKHVSLMVPYAPGGPADALARIFSGPLARELGHHVVVDNLGGAGGVLGAQKVLSEPADGHSLLQGSPNEVILAPALNPAVKLRVDDFALVQPLVRGILVLLARKDLPVQSADDVVALARQRADKPLSYGSVGVGSLNHLIMERVARETGTRFLHVPYKGSAPLLQDLGGGQIDVAVVVYSPAIAGMVEKDVLKVLGQFGAQRSSLLRQVPTVNEGRALQRLAFTTWNGVMTRKGIPEAAGQRLNRALATVMQSQQLRETLEAQFLEPATPMAFDEAAQFLRSEVETYRAMLANVNLKMQ